MLCMQVIRSIDESYYVGVTVTVEKFVKKGFKINVCVLQMLYTFCINSSIWVH